ncbi:MAG: hypothetical protein COT18_08805 [Elusimicrobia bacterium CG08_land_8_20_14_0_20_59_10]|nr:MAG: hypothetical protein COT18_08805 [Elusimicrobia bacterium CG08_land_8_20_14_0_20_59_10]
MRGNKKIRLSAAAAFAFYLLSFGLAGARGAGSAALNSLIDTAGPSNYVEIAAERVSPPAASAVLAPDLVRAAAPKPGKDFLPVVQDQARIKAIMKLISDIYNGVHLPYSQDGATFSNKEGGLPVQPKGFYKEYTLLTGNAPHTVTIGETTYQVAPDLSARGSERIIIGGGEKIYYTPDHYKTYIQFIVVY